MTQARKRLRTIPTDPERLLDEVLAEDDDALELDEEEEEPKVFKLLGPKELAAPVPKIKFMINGVLARNTFGPAAGAKKTLKTYNSLAMGVAVAAGVSLYKYAKFAVTRAEPVLMIVGEGGEIPYRRILQRMATAYGVDLKDLPIYTLFGAAPMDSVAFQEEVKAALDKVQPALTILDSLYNFHPGGIENGSLYDRGPLLAEYHRFVQEELTECTSLIVDHFNKNTSALDLDSIGMTGQSQNADSWILQRHRKPPVVDAGKFYLGVEFGSRQWGGWEWNVNWNIGAFDHDAHEHVGDISWQVLEAAEDKAEKENVKIRTKYNTDEIRVKILEFIDSEEFTSRDEAVRHINGHTKIAVNTLRANWSDLLKEEAIVKNDEGIMMRAPVKRVGPAVGVRRRRTAKRTDK